MVSMRRPVSKRATRSTAPRPADYGLSNNSRRRCYEKENAKIIIPNLPLASPGPHIRHGRAGRVQCACSGSPSGIPGGFCTSSCPERAGLLKHGREESTFQIAHRGGPPGAAERGGGDGHRRQACEGRLPAQRSPGFRKRVSGASRVTKQQRRCGTLPKFSGDSH